MNQLMKNSHPSSLIPLLIFFAIYLTAAVGYNFYEVSQSQSRISVSSDKSDAYKNIIQFLEELPLKITSWGEKQNGVDDFKAYWGIQSEYLMNNSIKNSGLSGDFEDLHQVLDEYLQNASKEILLGGREYYQKYATSILREIIVSLENLSAFDEILILSPQLDEVLILLKELDLFLQAEHTQLQVNAVAHSFQYALEEKYLAFEVGSPEIARNVEKIKYLTSAYFYLIEIGFKEEGKRLLNKIESNITHKISALKSRTINEIDKLTQSVIFLDNLSKDQYLLTFLYPFLFLIFLISACIIYRDREVKCYLNPLRSLSSYLSSYLEKPTGVDLKTLIPDQNVIYKPLYQSIASLIEQLNEGIQNQTALKLQLKHSSEVIELAFDDINNLTHSILKTKTHMEFSETIIQYFIRCNWVEAGAFYLADTKGRNFVRYAYMGFPEEFVPEKLIHHKSNKIEKLIQESIPLKYPFENHGFQEESYFPIIVNKKIKGYFKFYERKSLSPEDFKRLNLLVKMSGIAYRNA